jgi:YihY family inner membrane protein
MNPVERVIRRADRAQQRHLVPAFVCAVIKKFGDDNGGALVANLAYAGFVSVFPLLLIVVTILVNIAAAGPTLRADVIGTVDRQFPLVGHQLAGADTIHVLKRSTVIGLVAGLLLLMWGAIRLAQAGLFTMAQVWNLPGPARPGYLPRLGRAVAFLGLLGLGALATTLLAGLDTYGRNDPALVVLAEALAAGVNAAGFLAGFRVLTPAGVRTRRLIPGAVAGGVAWTVLQAVGAYLVHHDLRSASVYGIFATVLVLLAWMYLGAEVAVYAAEVNVVLTRRLWPRALVQPPLTEADRAALALQALQNQRRPEQDIEVTYNDRPAHIEPPHRTPRRPGDVSPPAQPRRRGRPRAK